jgi:CPA1 family monovalent cation:H+ antiporter
VVLVHLVVTLLLAAVALAWAARRMRLPYPIALVCGSALLGTVRELPPMRLDPELVLAVFVPPVLYQAALLTSWRDFKRWRLPISALAVGLVIATTLAVGAIARWLIPDMPWAAAFALGAIVSPPDAVAATAILATLRAPRRLVAVLEGESLVNDASGLVLYKLAVVAAVSGAFSVSQAGIELVLVSLGGVAIGGLLAFGFGWAQRHIRDPLAEVLLTLTLPYTAYLLCERLALSGVLAVVTAGLVRSRAMAGVAAPETRIMTLNVWNVMVFLCNSLVFMIIGLALPRIVEELLRLHDARLYWYALAIVGTAVAVRMLWIGPGGALMQRLMAPSPQRGWHYPWRESLVMGWAGMRGIVTIAAALALPHTVANGEPFPHRLLIIFLAFAVVLVTLLAQGVTLRPLIALLKLQPDDSPVHELLAARTQMAHAALAEVNGLAATGTFKEQAVTHVRDLYAMRLERLDGRSRQMDSDLPDTMALRQAALQAERKQMTDLWLSGRLGDESRRVLERELDLLETSLASEARH